MKAAKLKTVFSFSLGLLLLFVTAAQARMDSASGASELKHPGPSQKQSAAGYDYDLFSGAWGISPDMLIGCDPQGSLLAKVKLGSMQTARSLQSGVCLRPEPVIPAQPAVVPETAACKDCGAAQNPAAKSSTGVTGESSMLKVQPATTEVQYVYLQCGKKVAVYGPPGCKCSPNANYINSCVKPKTVFITIPCH